MALLPNWEWVRVLLVKGKEEFPSFFYFPKGMVRLIVEAGLPLLEVAEEGAQAQGFGLCIRVPGDNEVAIDSPLDFTALYIETRKRIEEPSDPSVST